MEKDALSAYLEMNVLASHYPADSNIHNAIHDALDVIVDEAKQAFYESIKQPESETLIYAATLPPSRALATSICGLANSSGGRIVLGVAQRDNRTFANGLAPEFHTGAITGKALGLLSPRPRTLLQFFELDQKKFFIIDVDKSPDLVSIEDEIFMRRGPKTVSTGTRQDICAPVCPRPDEPQADDYTALRNILFAALAQASDGKGKERHAAEGERFEDQQIVQLGEWMGANGSTHFAVGQACKKALESTRLTHERAKAELLGAINYLAAAVLVLKRRSRQTLERGEAEIFHQENESELRRLPNAGGQMAHQISTLKNGAETSVEAHHDKEIVEVSPGKFVIEWQVQDR